MTIAFTLNELSSLLLQLGVILLAARLFGILFRKTGLPAILGEVLVGMLIGPHILGRLPLPMAGFPNGIFPFLDAETPIPPPLLIVGAIGAILFLFMEGLETDLRHFGNDFCAGTIVGLGGVVVSFALGVLFARHFLPLEAPSPAKLMVGLLCATTSIGVTAHFMSARRCTESPEGRCIATAAIADDLYGMLILAVILAYTTSIGPQGASAGKLFSILLKAALVLIFYALFATAVAKPYARIHKSLSNRFTCASFTLGGALVLAGLFQKFGLSFILGAYAAGICLARNPVAGTIQERMRGAYNLFVPVFFVLIGMLVDIRGFQNSSVILAGILYAFLAILGKIIGCGIPALFFKFNGLGALRIGMGMIPRGELALVFTGICAYSTLLANDSQQPVLDSQTLCAVILMVVITSVLAPMLFGWALRLKGKSVGIVLAHRGSSVLEFPIASPAIRDFLIKNLIQNFVAAGFSDSSLSNDDCIVSFKNKDTSFVMNADAKLIRFQCDLTDLPPIKSVVNETAAEISQTMTAIYDLTLPTPEELAIDKKKNKANVIPFQDTPTGYSLTDIIPQNCALTGINAKNFEDALKQLVNHLADNGYISSYQQCLNDIKARETVISTMLPGGIALPHARTTAALKMVSVIALCHLEEKPESDEGDIPDGNIIVVMTISPKHKQCPYMQYIAHVASVLHKCPDLETLKNIDNPEELRKKFTEQ